MTIATGAIAPITRATTVNDAVTRFPATLPLLAALGADSCCGGAKSIEEVARIHGADEAALLALLNQAAGET
jgi:iron-sulfur cluster repair protein YtfE (RIC family)